MKYKNFSDIPKFTRSAKYAITVDCEDIENTLNRYRDRYDLDMDPDFQRGHVWSENQQIAYLEFCLRGGLTGNQILFNSAGWMSNNPSRKIVLVDGKQRLEAWRRFLNNEIKVFDSLYKEYEGYIGNYSLTFMINDLPTRAEVLQWYIDLNSGGTVHSNSEINRVRELLNLEKNISESPAP